MFDIKRSDVVVDVGPYVGLTTGIFAKRGEKVIGLEASPRNYKLLDVNTSNLDNVEVYNLAASSESGEVELNIEGTDQTDDDSILSPDSGKTKKSVTVQAIKIEDIVSKYDVDEINFLKVEAEGAEPEVIEGIRDLKIDKIVVNCSPERDGKSPLNEIEELLRKKGYDIVDSENYTLHARYSSSDNSHDSPHGMYFHPLTLL